MAEIKFKPVARKSPVTKEVKFYAQKVTYSLIKSSDLMNRIKQNSAVPRGSVRFAISAILDACANFVCNGHSVQLGNMVSLRPTVQGKGVASADKYDPRVERPKVLVRAAWGSDLVKMQRPEYYTIVKDKVE